MTSESIVNFPVFANLFVSSIDKMDPGLSNEVAGTHEGIPQKNFKGAFSPLFTINSTPSTPKTLAISCGSATTPTVPFGITNLENSTGINMELSTWTCASINPGEIY